MRPVFEMLAAKPFLNVLKSQEYESLYAQQRIEMNLLMMLNLTGYWTHVYTQK